MVVMSNWDRRRQMDPRSAVFPPDLVDSHVHLDRYADDVVDAMVTRAAVAGVRRLLTIGTNLATSRAALRLAGRRAEVCAAVGIHPTRLGALDRQTPPDQQLRDLLLELHQDPLATRPSAIGEVGLDESAPDLNRQQRFLEASLTIAEGARLPLVLHVVGSPAVHEAALALVRRHPTVRTVAHYFVGGPALAQRYLDAGCWISVGRPVTRPTETAVRAAVPAIPADRLLLETDTYPLPGRTTEPRDVAAVCAAVAELTGRSYAEVAAATTASFGRFIGSTKQAN
jgi:TatD DNase family protein